MAFSTVISIEPDKNLIRFMSAQGSDKSSIHVVEKEYKAQQFSDKFFEIFTEYLQEYSQNNVEAMGKSAQVTVILPDNLVLTDTISAPIVKKRVEEMVNVAMEAKYKNLPDLKLNKFMVAENKNYVTYGVSAIRSKIVQSIYTAFSGNNMFANVITFAGSSSVNGAIAVNSKIKSDSFVWADIKENSCKLCYVIGGTCMGSYSLPFGHGLLASGKVAAENMLFNHPVAELAVVNAKEKAKAKQLTMMDSSIINYGEADDEEEDIFANTLEENREVEAPQIKVLPKKTPRVLPKFMQRPDPTNAEETAYENFRYFEKYILEFIRNNKRLSSITEPSYVLVNLPAEYSYLIDKTNESEKENGVQFRALNVSNEGSFVPENMELYGALFAAQYNKNNNF